MGLSVTTIAPTRLLTTRPRVKSALGETSTTYDELFDALIREASFAIESYCHRPFAREAYTELLPGFGGIHLMLKRTPVVSVGSVSQDSAVITDYTIAEPDQGLLYRRGGWAWTAQTYPGLGASGIFLDMGSPLPMQEEPQFSVAYVAGYILPPQNVTSTTISAANADNSFNDSASGFPGLLKAGDVVETSGFATAANNGRFLVSGTPTTSKIVVTGGTLTTEAEKQNVTVYVQTLPNDIEKAAIEAVKTWYVTRSQDGNVVEKQAGPMRIRYSEQVPGQMPNGLPATCVGLLRPWVRAA